MAQNLQLPLKDLRVSAAYKAPQYHAYWGFHHYGMDCTGPDRTVLACGDGEVVAAGQDGATLTGKNARLGNVIVVIYRDVERNDGQTGDLTCRMYHLEHIYVKAGDRIKRGDPIGVYGNTGYYTTGPHLHIEFDTDVQYPRHAYGVSSGGRIILAGTIDSSVNPDRVWFLGAGQTIQGAQNGWYTEDDTQAPFLPAKEAHPRLTFDVYARLGTFEDAMQAAQYAALRKEKIIIQAAIE